MSRFLPYVDFFHRPEGVLTELLQKFARGELLERGTPLEIFRRALVVAVDLEGGRLESPDVDTRSVYEQKLPDGKTVSFSRTVGPRNPRNAIKARILTDGQDQFFTDDDLRVFWPLLPEHVSVPVIPGEHVYVMFEDQTMRHGLWIGKVSGHEGVNFFKGEDSYEPYDQQRLASLFPDSSGLPDQERHFVEDRTSTRTFGGDRLKGAMGLK